MRLRRAVKRRLSALGGRILLKLFWTVRNRDPDRSADAAARFMRTIGPWLRGHRVARRNLVAAFPEKTQGEIEIISRAMWDNFGRVIAEYAFLDRLWDFSPNDTGPRRIAIDRADLDRAARIHETGKPILCSVHILPTGRCRRSQPRRWASIWQSFIGRRTLLRSPRRSSTSAHG